MQIDFSDITFVIPSNREYIKTTQSIPPQCQTIISRSYTQGQARNDGVMQAKTPWIALCDDDIKFNTLFLEYITSLANPKSIVGLQGYYPSPFLISRFMLFHISAWDKIGNMLPVRHGEETEWLIRAIKKGYKLISIPRESVYHYPHKKATFKHEYSNLLWLLRLHPDFPLIILKTILQKMEKSSNDDEYITITKKVR